MCVKWTFNQIKPGGQLLFTLLSRYLFVHNSITLKLFYVFSLDTLCPASSDYLNLLCIILISGQNFLTYC